MTAIGCAEALKARGARSVMLAAGLARPSPSPFCARILTSRSITTTRTFIRKRSILDA
jgi:hypothetical protein